MQRAPFRIRLVSSHSSVAKQAYDIPMKLLDALASLFINTFGITQPTDQTRRRASWFIFLLLVLALSVVATVGALIYHWMHA